MSTANVTIDDFDPRIKYSAGWEAFTTGGSFNGTKHGAEVAGLAATFNFTGKPATFLQSDRKLTTCTQRSGTWVSVYGPLGSVDVYGVPKTVYEIDGVFAGSYTAPVVPPGGVVANVQYFSSAALTPGAHTLVITNVNGTSPNVFWLDYIRYTPSSAATTSAAATSAGQTAASTTSAPAAATGTADAGAQGSSTHTAAIAGGVAGGVALVALLAAVLFYFLRFRRRRAAEGSLEKLDVDPGEIVATSTGRYT